MLQTLTQIVNIVFTVIQKFNIYKKLKFIDLFAGIGGFHLTLHKLGAKCVYASEIDEHARKTYEVNFKKISPNLFRNNYKPQYEIFRVYSFDCFLIHAFGD